MTDDRRSPSEAVPDLPPALMVEKLALGELPDRQARAVREQLGEAADDRLLALAQSNEEILREHPPSRVAAEVQRRLDRLEAESERDRARSGPGWMVWAPVAAAAGLALVWWIGTGDRAGPGSDSDQPEVIAKADPSVVPDAKGLGAADGPAPERILLKGDPVLMIDRMVDGRPAHMSAEDRVAAGDLLQVKYNAKGAQQGVVVSVDGAGVATLHFPDTEGEDPRLDHGGAIHLPQSYELDDAPGYERFFFVTVDVAEPRLDVTRVVDAARALAGSEEAERGSLALPEGWRQQSLLLRK